MTSVIVDPRDGTIIETLADVPTDQLANLAVELRRRETDLKTWRAAAEDELRRRLEREGRRNAVIGDYQLQVDGGRRRAWDPDELESTLHDLVGRGVLHAREAVGVIVRDTQVNGTRAKELLDALTGEPRAAVERCFRWESRGRPRLTITPVTGALREGARRE